MRYYQCKCGALKYWGSMPPPACDWCIKCGSNPARGPDGHRAEPIAHEMEPTTVQTDSGPATLSRCRHCHFTRAEIDAMEQRRRSAER